jgi:hypothetical protein
MFNFRPKVPWLHVPTEPLEEAPPGFHVTPEASQRPWWDVFSMPNAYTPDFCVGQRVQANVDGVGHDGSLGNPEEFNWSVQPAAPVVPSETDPYQQSGVWPRPDRMPKSSGPEANAEPTPEILVPGFRVEDDAQRHPSPADDWRPDSWPQNVQGGPFDIGSEPPVGNRPGSFIASAGSYASNLSSYDPVYFPEPPPNRVQHALDEIARLYGLDPFRPTGLTSRPGSSIRTNNAEDGAREDYPTVNGLDPRYILPANVGGMRPPPPPSKPPTAQGQPSPQNQRIQTRPSNTHNNSPDPTSPPKSGYPRPAQPVHPSGRPVGERPLDVKGSAIVAELLAPKADLDKHIERIRPAARVRDDAATNNQSVPPGGLTTKAGVQMHPDAPPPAVDELPIHEHLKNGVIGEQQLVNRIMTTLPGERVLYYGNAAGQQGADIISVSPEGNISVWDSKWRGGPRPMSEGARARRKNQTLDSLCDEVKGEIIKAVEAGRLPLHIAAKAMENATAKNFFINTIGTGSAHRGVSQYIGGCEPGEFRRF